MKGIGLTDGFAFENRLETILGGSFYAERNEN